MTLCRSDLVQSFRGPDLGHLSERDLSPCSPCLFRQQNGERTDVVEIDPRRLGHADRDIEAPVTFVNQPRFTAAECRRDGIGDLRSEEHTSELQSLMRISYAVFCLKKKKNKPQTNRTTTNTYYTTSHTSQ